MLNIGWIVFVFLSVGGVMRHTMRCFPLDPTVAPSFPQKEWNAPTSFPQVNRPLPPYSQPQWPPMHRWQRQTDPYSLDTPDQYRLWQQQQTRFHTYPPVDQQTTTR